MNHLISGGYNPEKLDLLLGLTSIRSPDIISGIKEHLIRGASIEVAAALSLCNAANLTRALKKLNEVAITVQKINDINRKKESSETVTN